MVYFGTSSTAGKGSGNLSLDALAKAKKALQMQKEVSEKLKKLPLLYKGASSTLDSRPQTRSVPATELASALPVGSSSKSLRALAMGSASLKPEHGTAGLTTIPNVKRAHELAAKMGFRQDPQFAPLKTLFPGQTPVEVSVPHKPKFRFPRNSKYFAGVCFWGKFGSFLEAESFA